MTCIIYFNLNELENAININSNSVENIPAKNNNINNKNNLTQVQVSNNTLSKGLNNMVINSSKSVESNGNLIDNYIKMEALYLRDGKINSNIINYDASNTYNNITNNNNNSKFDKKEKKKVNNNIESNIISNINYE